MWNQKRKSFIQFDKSRTPMNVSFTLCNYIILILTTVSECRFFREESGKKEIYRYCAQDSIISDTIDSPTILVSQQHYRSRYVGTEHTINVITIRTGSDKNDACVWRGHPPMFIQIIGNWHVFFKPYVMVIRANVLLMMRDCRSVAYLLWVEV